MQTEVLKVLKSNVNFPDTIEARACKPSDIPVNEDLKCPSKHL